MSSLTVDGLLAELWRNYTATTAQAERIHRLLTARGETVLNDHVALRTFGAPAVGLEVLARPFEALGWRPRDDYRFAEKHLRARYWLHPEPGRPKVFISELVVEELSAAAQRSIEALVAQLPTGFGDRPDLPWAGRPWTVSLATYRSLLEESEYAGWMAAFGFRVNHFTVDVRSLRSFEGLGPLTDFLVANGFRLNESGGRIKGTPAERLEQSSTLADAVELEFSDGKARVPSCYYEFARRYPLPSGELFQGFIPASADKIFESTDQRLGRG